MGLETGELVYGRRLVGSSGLGNIEQENSESSLSLIMLLFALSVCMAIGQYGYATQCPYVWVSFSEGYANTGKDVCATDTSSITSLGPRTSVRLSQSPADGLVIEIEIPGIYLCEKLTNGKKFVSVNVPPYDSATGPHVIVTSTSETGKAKLPIFRAFMAIPEHAEMIQPEIIASSCVLEDIYAYPVGKLVAHNGRIARTFVMDDGFYSSDVLYPTLLARAFGNSMYLRDTHLACLEICPFQYNPARKQLICHWKMRLRIPLRFRSAQADSGILSDMCSKTVLNYSQAVHAKAPSMRDASADMDVCAAAKEGNVCYPTDLSGSYRVDYLIIAPDVFCRYQKVSDLASWRAKYNGFDVAVVNTSDIYGQFGDGGAGIRDFIRYVYDLWPSPNSSDGHVSYVLLIGDTEYIPAHLSDNGIMFLDSVENVATDNWYACLSGEDLIPDVMLGRLSVKDIHELDVVVSKIIEYEKNPYRGEWMKRALLITGTIDNLLDDLEYTIEEILLPAGYLATEVSMLAGHSSEDVIHQMNRGHIIVDYAGHGFKDGWEIFRAYSIPSLRNKRALPVIFSMACNTAAFDDEEDCFAEAMVKAPNGGCVAYFGASRLSPVSEVSFSLSRGMVQNHLFVLGEIVMNAKLLSALSNENIELYNLLGDPALSLYAPRRDTQKEPDLAISPADITLEPEDPLPDSPVKITAVVHNIGEADAENVIVEFLRDGNNQQLIGEQKIDHISSKGTGEVSVSWRVPRAKAHNRILVQANTEGGEEYSYDNYAVKSFELCIEASNFPIAIDSVISTSTYGSSAPVLYDLDGDGCMELITQGEISGSSYFYICAWHHDGALVKNFPIRILAANRYRKEEVELSPAVGDVDRDGFAEIACTFRTKKVYLLHHDGRIASGFPVQLRAFAASSPVLYDVNGDGKLEIILALTNGEVDVLKDDGTPLDGFPAFIYSNSQSAFVPPTVAIGDVDGDGKPEIVVRFLRLYSNLGEYVLLNHDGSRVETSPIEIPWVNLLPPSLGDIDNDSCAEVILVSEEKNIYALNHNGTLAEGFPTVAKDVVTSPPVLGDIDGDGSLEIVATSLDYIHAWYHDGIYVSGFPIRVRGENSHPILADMDGDGRSEIMFVNNGIRAYHHDGSPVDGFPVKKFDNYRLSAPSLADIDEDGYLEMAVITSGREIHLLDDVGIYNPKRMEWSAALHDAMNTSSYSAEIALPVPEIHLESAQRDSDIVLSWRKDPLTDVNSYRILRANSSNGPFSTLAKVGKDRSTYVDSTATVDLVYWYKIVAENGDASFVSNIARACLMETSSGPILRDVCNYPNPAPGAEHPDSTIFRYYVAENAKVRIRIYSITGQLVDEINHDTANVGVNEVKWEISSVASGLYFYVVEATGESGGRVSRKGKLAVIK